ncbi:MAG: hypothetical protein VB125_04245 [Burkholderia sp.]
MNVRSKTWESLRPHVHLCNNAAAAVRSCSILADSSSRSSRATHSRDPGPAQAVGRMADAWCRSTRLGHTALHQEGA